MTFPHYSLRRTLRLFLLTETFTLSKPYRESKTTVSPLPGLLHGHRRYRCKEFWWDPPAVPSVRGQITNSPTHWPGTKVVHSASRPRTFRGTKSFGRRRRDAEDPHPTHGQGTTTGLRGRDTGRSVPVDNLGAHGGVGGGTSTKGVGPKRMDSTRTGIEGRRTPRGR